MILLGFMGDTTPAMDSSLHPEQQPNRSGSGSSQNFCMWKCNQFEEAHNNQMWKTISVINGVHAIIVMHTETPRKSNFSKNRRKRTVHWDDMREFPFIISHFMRCHNTMGHHRMIDLTQ